MTGCGIGMNDEIENREDCKKKTSYTGRRDQRKSYTLEMFYNSQYLALFLYQRMEVAVQGRGCWGGSITVNL
jgi:hypothetical protein